MASKRSGRIEARPSTKKTLGSTTTGLRRTGVGEERDGFLYVPDTVNFKAPVPLLVMLHGPGGDAQDALDPIREHADRAGIIVLAPESQGQTWDGIEGTFGEDTYLMEEALIDAFALYPIDPKRIAIGGFSDGASYALTLGAINKDLFTHILAFSPSFINSQELRDLPPVFISHGSADTDLPIESTRGLVPKLQSLGLQVTYHEFEGGHAIPADVGRRAFAWFLGRGTIAEKVGANVRSIESEIELT